MNHIKTKFPITWNHYTSQARAIPIVVVGSNYLNGQVRYEISMSLRSDRKPIYSMLLDKKCKP